jgi:hypothetical protein
MKLSPGLEIKAILSVCMFMKKEMGTGNGLRQRGGRIYKTTTKPTKEEERILKNIK